MLTCYCINNNFLVNSRATDLAILSQSLEQNQKYYRCNDLNINFTKRIVTNRKKCIIFFILANIFAHFLSNE